MVDLGPATASSVIPGQSELIAQLQNIARQLSAGAQSINNVTPIPTTTSSPKFTAVTLSTATSVLVATSTLRHGIFFHNPATTNAFVFATGMTSPPSSSNFAGGIVIYPGGSLSFPSAMFANSNAGFSGFAQTGASQPFTVIEFF
jgi:hypothetical protein